MPALTPPCRGMALCRGGLLGSVPLVLEPFAPVTPPSQLSTKAFVPSSVCRSAAGWLRLLDSCYMLGTVLSQAPRIQPPTGEAHKTGTVMRNAGLARELPKGTGAGEAACSLLRSRQAQAQACEGLGQPRGGKGHPKHLRSP